MEDIFNGHFYSPSRGNLTFDGVIQELLRYVSEKPEMFYDVVVGCDSSSEEEPHFPIATVILRKGEGGRFFLKKIHYTLNQKRFFNWKTRILEEVMLSCQFALLLKENLEREVKKLNFKPDYQFRYIHADVGENGATKDMIKEVVGLIRGNGFEPKIKPESYVASVVADRYS